MPRPQSVQNGTFLGEVDKKEMVDKNSIFSVFDVRLITAQYGPQWFLHLSFHEGQGFDSDIHYILTLADDARRFDYWNQMKSLISVNDPLSPCVLRAVTTKAGRPYYQVVDADSVQIDPDTMK